MGNTVSQKIDLTAYGLRRDHPSAWKLARIFDLILEHDRFRSINVPRVKFKEEGYFCAFDVFQGYQELIIYLIILADFGETGLSG